MGKKSKYIQEPNLSCYTWKCEQINGKYEGTTKKSKQYGGESEQIRNKYEE